jgi:hypothetical protein
MRWWLRGLLWGLLGLYGIGFTLVFLLMASVGPVTLPLAFARALVWPWLLVARWLLP